MGVCCDVPVHLCLLMLFNEKRYIKRSRSRFLVHPIIIRRLESKKNHNGKTVCQQRFLEATMADFVVEQDASANEDEEEENYDELQDSMEDAAGEEDEKNDDGDDESLEDLNERPDDEEDELLSLKSQNTEEDTASVTSRVTDGTPYKGKAHKGGGISSSAKKGRTPSVAGLTIPFRTVKKAMKLDPDIPIVQNEAAIMATFAVELFLQRLAKDSFRNAKNRGRNTVRYEDVAEARTGNKALAFLEPLLP